jgi:predicted glycogen debranching enzyme
MDAKVDGWVVTPRRGKAVEINALWHNALCNVSRWTERARGVQHAARYTERAARVRESFNARFWNPNRGFLFDVIDGETGDSDLCRPNQVFAISLENPVLAREHWSSVLKAVEERLLTPVGLRSLAPGEPDYKERYFGDLRTRDAAYHQGTVWGWLIGPYVDAWLKVNPGDERRARELLQGLVEHLDDFGVGSVAEVFDATAPYTPRGCIAQAWSVAELLRCWAITA